MIDVLLDCVKYNPQERIFAVVHLTTNEISIVSPDKPCDFDYLGLGDWRNLTMVGESVVVTDDEGEAHRITLLVK